jgi:hypothetical protein
LTHVRYTRSGATVRQTRVYRTCVKKRRP